MLERQAEVLDLIQLETGKARLHAHEEVQAVAVAARHYGRKAPAYLRPKRHTGAVPTLTKVTELRQPRGVVGQIAPWNYPLELSVGDALPAFVAGNAVVMKPDTETALTALWARDLLIEAGLPAEVFQIVLGEGPVVGPEVVEHADYVSFTGSTRTGREVAQGAAARLVGVLPRTRRQERHAGAATTPTSRRPRRARSAPASPPPGQLCISIERLYVHESVADAFVERFAARTKAMRLGTSLAYGADMGSLVGERQLETVTRHVEEAVAKGATLVAGGVARPDIGPLLLRADHPRRRRGADGRVHRGDLRPGRLHLPLHGRGRGRRAGQRHRRTASTPASGPRTAAAAARSPPGCAPAPSTSTRATPPRTAASSPRWAA